MSLPWHPQRVATTTRATLQKRWSRFASPAVRAHVLFLDATNLGLLHFRRSILRKQDLRIMPLICLAYILNHLDRTNL